MLSCIRYHILTLAHREKLLRACHLHAGWLPRLFCVSVYLRGENTALVPDPSAEIDDSRPLRFISETKASQLMQVWSSLRAERKNGGRAGAHCMSKSITGTYPCGGIRFDLPSQVSPSQVRGQFSFSIFVLSLQSLLPTSFPFSYNLNPSQLYLNFRTLLLRLCRFIGA